MRRRSPIAEKNVLLEKRTPLTSADKKLFAYFGQDAKILPPLRVLNPQRIWIGDRTAVREGSHINAFIDLSFLLDYVAPQFQQDFAAADFRYDPQIRIDREVQIGRFFFVSCVNAITIERNVVLSERVFVGDNNHSLAAEQDRRPDRGRDGIVGRRRRGAAGGDPPGAQLRGRCQQRLSRNRLSFPLGDWP